MPWCNSYWKGSFWVTLDYGHQLYLLIFGSVNGTSTPYGLFGTKIWFICKCFIIIITRFSPSIPIIFLIMLYYLSVIKKFSTQLYGFKYSYLILIICTYLFIFKCSYQILIIHIHNYIVSSNNSYSVIFICLHTAIWSQVFLFITNNFQTDLFDLYMGI